MSRSGSTAVGPIGPYIKQWYRDFWSESGEQIADGYQPVIVNDAVHNLNLVYIGTTGGALYALDMATGATFWRYPAVGQNIGGIVSPPTIQNGVIYLASLDGNIYALDGTNNTNGTPAVLWTFSTGRQGGFWATPASDSSNLYIGARDGYFYAINLTTGAKAWEYNVGAPILMSAAYDSGVVYFGAEDLHAYALNTNGTLLWQSATLAGRSFRNGYPVLTSSLVMFRTAPNDNPLKILPEEEQVLAFAAGCMSYPPNPNNDRSNASCFNWKATAMPPSSYTVESQAVVSYLSGAGYQGIPGRPQYESFHTLLRTTGQKPFVTPVLWTSGNGSPGVAPVVDQNGKVWVLYRSYYSDYDSPSYFIMGAFGQMNQSSGAITIRNPNPNPTGYTCDQWSCNPSFGTNVWMIGDETTAFSVASNQIYTNNWSGLGTVDLTTGSMQSVIGERDNFVSALTSGAPRSLAYGATPPHITEITGPAIFNNVIVAHYDSVVAALAGQLAGSNPTPGPTSTPKANQPFTSTTAGPVTIPSTTSLQHYIWEVPIAIYVDQTHSSDLQSTLNSAVSSFLSTGRLAMWMFIPGKAAVKGYFHVPADTEYFLALAYPYLSTSLQSQVIAFVQADQRSANPLTGTYPLNQGLTYSNGQVTDNGGQQRPPFAPGPQDYCAVVGGCEGQGGPFYYYWRLAQPFDYLYEVWAYAYRTGDWNWITANWATIKSLKAVVDTTTDDGLLGMATDPTNVAGLSTDASANRRLSALIAYARIAYKLNDPTEVNWATNAATLAMQARLRFVNNFRPSDGNGTTATTSTWVTYDCSNGGMFVQRLGCHETNIPKYREMTPEVARLLADYAAGDYARYDQFVNVVHPTAYLASGGNQFDGEVMYTYPPSVQGLFLAKALVSRLAGPQLRPFLDIPWVNEDYYYWERLARTIDAYGQPATIDLTNPALPPVPLNPSTSIPIRN